MQHAFKRTEAFLTCFAAALAAVILLFLLQQSLFLTTQDTLTIDIGSTKGFYTADPLLPLHILLFAALGMLAAAAARLPTQRRAQIWRLVRMAAPAVAVLYGLLLAWAVLGLRMEPNLDDAGALDVALRLLAGDTTPLAAGGYINRFPAQSGIVVYDMVFVLLFGARAVTAMQAANIVWLILGAAALADAAACLWGCTQRRALYFLSALLWLPAGLYVTFVYGTLPALALSMAQLWCFARWRTRPALRWCLLGALCGALAAMLKQNYLVFSIACCLYFIWQTVRSCAVYAHEPAGSCRP